MQSQKGFVVILLVIFGLAAMAGAVVAAPAVSDVNLFYGSGTPGLQAMSSTELHAEYSPDNVMDAQGGGPNMDLVFLTGDPQERLVISGFDSSVAMIRLWTAADLSPARVTIRGSSTNVTSVNWGTLNATTTFETALASISALDGTWTTDAVSGLQYKDISVNAPMGTKSVYLDFGSGNGGSYPANGNARIAEVQATARMINIDVNGQGPGDTDAAAPVTYTGSAAAGGGTWNSYVVDSTAGIDVNPLKSGALQYADGSTSRVKFDLSLSGGDAITGNSGNALMDDYAVAPGSPASMSFTLEGLAPGGHYSLYMYGKPGAYGGSSSTFTIGSTALTPTSTVGFDGTFVENRDYVKFSDVQANLSGKITGTVTASSLYGILNGIQLVEGAFTDISPSIHESNLLSLKPVVFSSQLNNDSYAATNAVDGEGGDGGAGNDLVFGETDTQQRLVIHEITGKVGLIRIWTGDDLPPLRVTIKSSTSDFTDTNVDNFTGTTLWSETFTDDWLTDNTGRWYRDFAVNAPVGTQSLLFDFGGSNGGYGINNWNAGFARIQEIQAFAIVPEPSVFALLATGLIGLLAYTWRKRR